MPWGSALANPARDGKIVTQQRAWLCTVCVSTPNRFGLKLYNIINYNTPARVHKKGVFYWCIDNNKNFGLIYWGSKLFARPNSVLCTIYTGSRLTPKLMTLDNLERQNRGFVDFWRFRAAIHISRANCDKINRDRTRCIWNFQQWT